MTSKDVREIVTIEGDNYDCIYVSHITGKRASWKDLISGRFDSIKSIDKKDKGHITPKDITLVAFRKRTGIKGKLIVDIDDFEKPRCPRCFNAKVHEEANKRIRYSLGTNYSTNPAKVDFSANRIVRHYECARFCESCNTVYVKKEMVVDEY